MSNDWKIYSNNCEILVFGLVKVPSKRLEYILNLHKLVPVIYIEHNVDATKKNIKTTLTKNAAIYICINLINGNIYVGSGGKGYVYDRYRAHLHNAKKQGSKIVNSAVDKYGLQNFAFVILEYVSNEKDSILSTEQYYIDLLLPVYNIAKIAGSVIGVRRSIEQRLKQSLYIKSERYQHLVDASKNKSDLTKSLISTAAKNRQYTLETRKKISINSGRAITIIVTIDNKTLYTFSSIADCAEHFYKDRIKRGPIRWSISTGKLLFDKYTITKK